VTTKAKGATALTVTLTDAGAKLLGTIDGVQKTRNPTALLPTWVPLAVRTLVSVDKITMISAAHLPRLTTPGSGRQSFR